MRRTGLLCGAIAGIIALAWLFQFAPAALQEGFEHPFRVLIGSGRELNSTLLVVSENSESVNAARTLFKPFGMVRLIRSFPSTDNTTNNDTHNQRH